METLHNLFITELQNSLTFKTIGARLIAKKFGDFGIILTEEQIKGIENQLEAGELENFKIELSDEQVAASSIQPSNDPSIQIDLSDHDDGKIAEILDKAIQEALGEALPEVSDILLKALKSEATSMLKKQRAERSRFENNLRKEWGKALDLLEMLLAIVLESGGDFNEEFRPVASVENDYVFEVLTRIHARGCQIGAEVLTLLKSGFADGAHARWRTLHELAVVAFFVQKYGNDVAERYLLHEFIESYKAANEYHTYAEFLPEGAPSDEDLSELENIREQLLNRFGRSFKNKYGWAASVLNIDDPNFDQIEQDVGLAHERPYYRLASHNVHANPKGITFKLGLFPNQELLLAGPSIIGLADPGHGIIRSLLRITSTLLITRPNLDRLAIVQVMNKLEEEIGTALIDTHYRLEKDAHDQYELELDN
jgi:hypothetical protein